MFCFIKNLSSCTSVCAFFSMYVFFVGVGGGELYICKYTVNTKKANWGEIGV